MSTVPMHENAVNRTTRRSRRRLCSLRVISVTSHHFLGRRYVMELSTASRARELRVFRSFENLMSSVADFHLPLDTFDSLYQQLYDTGECRALDLLL